MDASKFATWKYKHLGAGYRSRKQWLFAAILFGVALVAQVRFHHLPLAIAFALIGLVVALLGSKKIFLGPRYLICGDSIVYYNNVERLELDEAAGRLLLVTASDQAFTLERERFPTNARKADKIARNKAAKFSKVAHNIIVRVQRSVPGVQASGLS
jgi:hypothetical protein